MTSYFCCFKVQILFTSDYITNEVGGVLGVVIAYPEVCHTIRVGLVPRLVVCDKMASNRYCPLCSSRGKQSLLKLYQINEEEAVYACLDPQVRHSEHVVCHNNPSPSVPLSCRIDCRHGEESDARAEGGLVSTSWQS